MPVLLREPSTKVERAVFFRALLKAVTTFNKGDGKSLRALRVVSDDTETLNGAAFELEQGKRNPTFFDSVPRAKFVNSGDDYKPKMPGDLLSNIPNDK